MCVQDWGGGTPPTDYSNGFSSDVSPITHGSQCVMGNNNHSILQLGELLVETEASYSPALHLSWGASQSMTTWRSRWRSFIYSVTILVSMQMCLFGRSGCQLCPITAILAYIRGRGDTPGFFFVDYV